MPGGVSRYVEHMIETKQNATDRKRQLLEKVKSQQAAKHGNLGTNDTSTEDTPKAHVDKSDNKERKKLEKQLERIQANLQTKGIELKQQQTENVQLRREIYELKQKNAALSQTVSTKDVSIESLQKELLSTKSQLESAVQKEQEYHQLKEEAAKQIRIAKKSKSKLDSKISNLHNQMSAQGRKITEMNAELAKTSHLKQRLAHYGGLIQNMQVALGHEQGIPELLALLINKEKHINFKSYRLLQKLVARLDKKLGLPSDIVVENNEKLGYIEIEDGQHYFYDLENTKYAVQDIASHHIQDGMPVKVIIEDEKATIKATYRAATHRTTARPRQIHRAEKRKDEVEYVQFGDVKVLIIGIENKNKYVERIKKHGATPIWHDPAEESDQRLKDKLKQANVVIVCTSHVRHNVMRVLSGYKEGIHEIKNDNEDNIAARVHFALVNNLVRNM